MRTVLTWTGILLAIGATAAHAQGAEVDSVQHGNNCRLAQQVLETGQPAPKRQWAISYATGCGNAGARALAAAIRRERASTDVEALEVLHMPAQGFRDRAIFEASVEVQERLTLPGGEPLPPDHLERTRVLAERLVGDEATPREVRSAAQCVLEGLRILTR